MIDIATRKHGPFDSRFPRPRPRTDTSKAERSADRDSVDTWEGEGGHVEAQSHREPALPTGLSWESFFALAYPGMKRHYFPAIADWYRYRDADRSRPQASPPAELTRRGPAVAYLAAGEPRSSAVSPATTSSR